MGACRVLNAAAMLRVPNGSSPRPGALPESAAGRQKPPKAGSHVRGKLGVKPILRNIPEYILGVTCRFESGPAPVPHQIAFRHDPIYRQGSQARQAQGAGAPRRRESGCHQGAPPGGKSRLAAEFAAVAEKSLELEGIYRKLGVQKADYICGCIEELIEPGFLATKSPQLCVAS
jgi:hypothetical protein